MEALLNICSAFGLSGAAGLNAYIPLLTISLMQKCGVLHLAKPYDIMGQWWVIILLAVLLAVELLADKFPGVDHVNDIIHTAIRPTAQGDCICTTVDTTTFAPANLRPAWRNGSLTDVG